MRAGVLLLIMGWAMGVLAQAPPPPQPQRPIYTALVTDVAPEVRNWRTFVPISVIAREFGATVFWDAAARRVRIVRPNAPEIGLTIDARTATLGTSTVTLDAAPFITQGRTMVPLRFIAQAYAIPVNYYEDTRSVHLQRANRVYVLPLESSRAGVIVFDPQDGELVRNPVRVQGQANVYEGALIIEVRDLQGQVLGRTIATAGMGGFYPFSVPIYYNLPSDDPARGRIVVFSQNGRGDDRILAQDSVEVMLASTI